MRWIARLLAFTVAVAAIVVVVAGGIYLATERGFRLIPALAGCEAKLGERTVDLTTEQAENAALIVALSAKRELPPRAATIAIATAIQESKISNLTEGDRDSVGLFQQRPSQGWGTVAQILDPVYATNKFYDALVKVPNYLELPITQAAQAVQRSGFPDAYAQHEPDARAIAAAFLGQSEASLSCVNKDAPSPEADTLGKAGLTSRASVVRRAIARTFGDLPLGGFQPGGVTEGHMRGSSHYEGRAIDVFFRPINAANQERGWALAHYLVANAERLNIRVVIFDDRIWTSGGLSRSGWRDYRVPSSSNGDQAILEHRDHVHVEVFD